jgi:molybdopterin biosynthesis enzyme
MAQLTDDCFAFNGPLLPVAEAEQLIGSRVNPVSGRERVPLRGAIGRVLAADIVAPLNLPPFDNSAVDGYGVSPSSTASPPAMRRRRRSSQARPCAFSPARRCPPAPTLSSCRRIAGSTARM